MVLTRSFERISLYYRNCCYGGRLELKGRERSTISVTASGTREGYVRIVHDCSVSEFDEILCKVVLNKLSITSSSWEESVTISQ